MTDPTWMQHGWCGHCPVPSGDEQRAQRCHYGCHPGVECAPPWMVKTSPVVASVPSYRPLCPTCRRTYSGSWRSHRCEVAS